MIQNTTGINKINGEKKIEKFTLPNNGYILIFMQ